MDKENTSPRISLTICKIKIEFTSDILHKEDGRTFFPDAPTQRGLRHVEELIAARQVGFKATILFVIQLEGAVSFSPNDRTQPAFREALLRAREAGVEILAYDCSVTETSIEIRDSVPVLL